MLKNFWKEWGFTLEELAMFAAAGSLFGILYGLTIIL